MASPASELPTALIVLCAASVSALTTAAALAYGRRRGMLDMPGQRRSHLQPTPRGGGIGIVFTTIVAAALVSLTGVAGSAFALPFAAATMLVAGVGWWDDHRPLGAGLRLVVHAAASLLLCAALVALAPAPAWLLWPVLVFLTMGLINAWNFMDGINGIAASQAGLIASALAFAFLRAGHPLPGVLAAVLAAACAGFLPFNFPRARIFLGDVGSGALGILLAGLLLAAWRLEVLAWPAAAALPSAFVLDSGLTLATRVLARRRWQQPHREHSYQWWVRSGYSHASVTLAYAAWTAVVAVIVVAVWPRALAPGLAALVLVYAVGAGLWWLSKRGLLARVRARRFQ